MFDTKTNTTKQLWNNLDRVCSFSKNKNKISISKLLVNNKKVTDSKEISDCFNNYFCTVGEQLSNNLAHSATSFKNYLPTASKRSMFCSPTTNSEIEKIISSLKNNKSPGPDNIGPKIIKSIADIVTEPLSFIYNMSFAKGIVPHQLKISKVILVYKKGNRNSVGNYRPISLLNVFEKILEKLMYKRLYDYLSVNNVLYDYQFGFRKYHSTSLALIDVMDDIYQQLDSGNIVIGIYLDLQKAFDTVDHSILLAKLYNYMVFVGMYITGLKITCMINSSLSLSEE